MQAPLVDRGWNDELGPLTQTLGGDTLDAGPLGSFAEEIGDDGHRFGDVPPAFSHLALISAAFQLDGDLSR